MKHRPLNLFWVAVFLFLMHPGCKQKSDTRFYTLNDFYIVPKTDVHFHYNSPDGRYLLFADSVKFRIVSPNVDSGRSPEEQLAVSRDLKRQYPDLIAFLGTFSVDHFGKPGFADTIISVIKKDMQDGASGVKIWKNIGMVLKDSAGRYVMADDPAFDPVFRYLQENDIPLMAHLGEPRNCWLPLEEMTLGNDQRYFSDHPEYHMYLHPEAPSYEDQINARDTLLQRYPGIRFTGAHLASLEWSIDELAKRLDKFPRLDVDMSARIGHLQYQSLADYEKVRNFMIKYADRLMYGTDASVSSGDTVYSRVTRRMERGWLSHWVYLATDSAITIDDLGGKPVKGLKLPAEVIDKIYNKNAEKFFTR